MRRNPGAMQQGFNSVSDFEAQAEHWNDFLRKIDMKEASPRIDSYLEKYGIPIDFWLEDFKDLPATVSRLENREAICGNTLTLFSNTVAPDLPGISGDLVVELDAEGNILRQWTIPANDPRVTAVKGSTLMFEERAVVLCHWSEPQEIEYTIWLAIEPGGSFRVVAPHEDPPGVERREDCPIPEGLPQSDYWRCFLYTDLDKGTPRTLLFQGPCT